MWIIKKTVSRHKQSNGFYSLSKAHVVRALRPSGVIFLALLLHNVLLFLRLVLLIQYFLDLIHEVLGINGDDV